MSYQYLKVEKGDGALSGRILKVTVSRPEKLNALSVGVLRELRELLSVDAMEIRSQLAGVILTGEGDRAFVAGADIREQRRMGPEEGRAFGALGQQVTTLLEELPLPVIACVNGYALGGGCELAMACDFIYATEAAKFGQPEVNLGLIPGFGGCVRLGRYVGPGRAKEMIYTGRLVNAEQAADWGLVNEVFPSKDAMLESAEETLITIGKKSPFAVATSKGVLNGIVGLSGEEALLVENAGFREVFESADSRIGTEAFLAKEVPQFVGR